MTPEDARALFTAIDIGLLGLIFVGKAVAGYYASRATSRLGHTGSQRGIAYGVLLPTVSYGLFTFSVFFPDYIDALVLVGLVILAVSVYLMVWGWHRYEGVLARVFDLAGERLHNARADDELRPGDVR